MITLLSIDNKVDYNNQACSCSTDNHLSASWGNVYWHPWNSSIITALSYWEVYGGPIIGSPWCRETPASGTEKVIFSSPSKRDCVYNLLSIYSVIQLLFIYSVIQLLFIYSVIQLLFIYSVIHLLFFYSVIYLFFIYSVINLLFIYPGIHLLFIYSVIYLRDQTNFYMVPKQRKFVNTINHIYLNKRRKLKLSATRITFKDKNSSCKY